MSDPTVSGRFMDQGSEVVPIARAARTRFQKAIGIPDATSRSLFASTTIRARAFFADDHTLIFNADATTALAWLREAGLRVDCIVTSPPFYGQRDYQVEGQIGLEDHPTDYLRRLVAVFDACRRVLRPTGSLWVNLGDTYWSGKGQSRGHESLQRARRFGLRPQDRTGDGRWCRPKQLLLIPHRLAIALQEDRVARPQ